MEAPETVEEIFERKRTARHRFDGMTLIEKIDMMAELRRDLDKVFGRRRETVKQPDLQTRDVQPNS